MVLCLIISSALGAALPLYMSDLSVHYGDKELFLYTLKVLAVIFTVTFLNRSFYNIVINGYVVGLVQFVRSYCYEKWLLSYELQTSRENRTDRYPQGEVLARIMTDTEALRELVTSGTFGIIIDLFFVFASLISFISLNRIGGIGLALVQVLACVLLIWGSKYMAEVFMSVRKARGDLYKTIADVIGGLKDNYYIKNGHYASKRSLGVFEEFLNKILLSNVWDAGYYSLAESLFPIFLAFAVFIIPNAQMTQVGLIFAFVDLIQRSIGPIKDVSSKVANIQRAASGVIRINEFIGDLELERSTELETAEFNFNVDEINVSIDKFTYPTRPNMDAHFHLQDIQFSGRRGELIGIVGLSGSGKSTLLNILCANIIPDQGKISISSEDKESFEFDFHDAQKFIQYRQLIGIVSQDSHIFSESLLFNITMGKDNTSDFDEFWDFVRENISYLKSWGISKDTKLDQNTLSLGQKQLISAIRACYLKKPIVLFDEISSSLDSNLEFALRQMVLLAQKNALTFIVAHRLETIINANTIIVMENGSMVAKGVHQDLAKSSDTYKSFIEKLG
ncbi:ABC transporter ATP-binding protein [Bacteriovorax sp. Seq25_V]|uniref:ATP-binding cassette domain-containing protein n=1 Tax=Bacteriovorax sp. Seq25_V TaxID=1201288 RepID=UPI00040436AB|nr:ABC transporter ATP-binding protein [Bacteriovorax sp. Seq25_V]